MASSSKRKRLVGVSALALALVLSSCSSGNKASTTPATTGSGGSTPAAKATGSPIKVGMVCTCTGAGGFGAFDVPGRDMYQAWADTVNAAGGLDGHPVQLIAKDDGGLPANALSDAQALVADHVLAVVDISVVDQTFASVLQQANIPVIGSEMNNLPFGTNPDFYPEGQTNNSAIQAVIETAKQAGATNLANVYCAESPDCAQSVPAFKTVGQQLGLPVTYDAEISATAPNYTAQCLAAEQQHITAIFIGDSSAVIAKFASDCAQQNYQPIFVTEGAGFGSLELSAPGLKDHLWNEFPGLPYFANTPAVRAANAAIDKYFPGERQNTTLWDQIDFMSWASGQVLADALKAGGLSAGVSPTAAQVVTGLDSLKGDTLGGLAVPLTYTAGQPHSVNCWFTTRVQNGVPSLVNGGKTTCASGASA